MREGVRVRACANLPGAGSTSLIPVSRGWGQGEVETPNLLRWLFDDVFEGVNLGVEVFWVCGLREWASGHSRYFRLHFVVVGQVLG